MQSTLSLLYTFPAVNRLVTSESHQLLCLKNTVGISAVKASNNFSNHLEFWAPPVMSSNELHSVTGYTVK